MKNIRKTTLYIILILIAIVFAFRLGAQMGKDAALRDRKKVEQAD